MKTVSIGPFLGINNRVPDFALKAEAGDRLRDATNTDIDNAGRCRIRDGQTLIQALTAPHSYHETTDGARFIVRASALYAVTVPAYSETLVKSLSSNSAMSYLEHDGALYFSNGTDSGMVVSGTVHPIGMATPAAPAVTNIAGALHSGRYQVGVTYSNSVTGRESGNAGTTLYELAATGALRVTLPGASAGATHINVYVSELNGSVAYLHSTVAVGTATLDVTSLATTTRPMNEDYEEPLPAGINLFFLKGRLCCTNGDMLYYGNPFRLGYYTPTNFIAFEQDATLAVAVDNGVYVAHGNRTQWIAGDVKNPDAVVNLFNYGAVLGTAFELHKTSTEKARVGWFGTKGIVVADQNGQATSVMADNVDLVAQASGCSTVLESNGYRRVLSCGWCLNVERMAATRYTNFDFTSLSGAYGTKADGLYELAGTDDNGTNIDWRIDLGKQDFGVENLKHLPAVYVGAASDEPLILVVTLPDGTEYEYPARSCSDAIEIHRVDLGKGLWENWYGLALKNERGSSVTLASVSFAPVASGRRI
jgi:hypothetical protein